MRRGQERYGSRERTRRRFTWVIWIGVIIAGCSWAIMALLPSNKHMEPDWLKLSKPIFVGGELTEYRALGEGEGLKLPLPIIQSFIAPDVRYEEQTESIILTTPDKLMLLKTNEKEASLNNKPVTLLFAAEQSEGNLYLPVHLLKELYGIEVHEDDNTGAVLLFIPGEQIQTAQVNNNLSKPENTIALRNGQSIYAPIMSDMPQGSDLRILDTIKDWYYVQMDSGYIGYVRMKDVTLGELRTISEMEVTPSLARKKWGDKPINLTWEAVYEVAPNPSKIGTIPGVNVVSPTWFHLVDETGNVKSKADKAYVTWAHKHHMQVWGLFSNSFDSDMTTVSLSTYDNRMRSIVQMLHYAQLYDLDGINIDYENVYTKDKDNLTQFLRELRPLAQELGLVISIDVTPKSNSEMWSLFLDRQAYGEIVDYLILMAYDEHWAASPLAGSVASLPWVERSVSRILDEDNVPPEKLILGIPLYTRVWSEVEKDGKLKMSSKSIGMQKVQDIIKQYSLKPVLSEDTGQNYVEYQEDGVLKQIWIEDKDSLAKRVELAKKYKLAGVATWTRSFASPEAWKALAEILK